MRRTEQLKLFDSSKSVVVAIDNKLPSLDASNLYNFPNSSLGGLLFKAPKIDSETITYNLYIEFSADGTFATTTTYNTTDASHRNLFKVFSGQQLTDFPESGISLPFSNEVVSFDITELNKELKYFRFRWNNGSDFGGYGFGKTDSLLQIFDSGSSLDKVSVGIGLSGDGSESNPLNVDLSSYETTAGISIQGLNIDLISDGNFDIKGTALNIGDNTTNIPIVLNGHTQNSAGGLVILDSNGKLPALDGSQLTNLPNSGLSSVSVGSGLTGNGTSSSPIKLDLSLYSVDTDISIDAKSIELSGSMVKLGKPGNNPGVYLYYDKRDPESKSIYLNNNPLNTAGGLVEIGSDGKIPKSLYNAGSSSEITEVKPLLIELNGSNSTSDGITVTYDNENHIVTIIHNLNSYVNGILFDEYGKQALLGIDFVDLNTVSIQFTSQIMPTSESIWKLYLGTQNYNYVYSNAVQTKTISTKDIVFDPNKSIYVIDVTENTLITFDKSNLNIDENIYTFEIWIKMTEAYTIGFSGAIEWLDEPDLTAGGFYCFVVRFMPTSYYPTSLGNRDAIMSLSYRI